MEIKNRTSGSSRCEKYSILNEKLLVGLLNYTEEKVYKSRQKKKEKAEKRTKCQVTHGINIKHSNMCIIGALETLGEGKYILIHILIIKCWNTYLLNSQEKITLTNHNHVHY